MARTWTALALESVYFVYYPMCEQKTMYFTYFFKLCKTSSRLRACAAAGPRAAPMSDQCSRRGCVAQRSAPRLLRSPGPLPPTLPRTSHSRCTPAARHTRRRGPRGGPTRWRGAARAPAAAAAGRKGAAKGTRWSACVRERGRGACPRRWLASRGRPCTSTETVSGRVRGRDEGETRRAEVWSRAPHLVALPLAQPAEHQLRLVTAA